MTTSTHIFVRWQVGSRAVCDPIAIRSLVPAISNQHLRMADGRPFFCSRCEELYQHRHELVVETSRVIR